MAQRRDRIKLLRQTVGLLNHSLAQLQNKGTNPTQNIVNYQSTFQSTKANIMNIYPKGQHQTCAAEKRLANKENQDKPKRRRQFQKMQRSISSSLKHTMRSIDKEYYQQKSPFTKTFYQVQKQQNSKKNGSETQRGYQSKIYDQSQKRPSKLKTYQIKKTDILLNPELYIQKGKKKFNKIQRSPYLMLNAHPNSNQSAFCFNNQECILPKKATQSKTKSSLVMSPLSKQMIPSKYASIQEKQPSSQRKHYQRYYQQILKSQMEN